MLDVVYSACTSADHNIFKTDANHDLLLALTLISLFHIAIVII